MQYRVTDVAGNMGVTRVVTPSDVENLLIVWFVDGNTTPQVLDWINAVAEKLPRGEPCEDEAIGLGVRIERVSPFVVEVHRTEYIAYEVWATDEDTAGERYGVDGEEIGTDIVSEEFMGITEGTREVLDRR